MDPRTPDDLLLRQSPVDEAAWLDGPETSSNPNLGPGRKVSVSLERFQELERIIRDSPINVDPYLELSRIYFQNSRWNDAKRILDQAVDRFPEIEDAIYLREEAQLRRSLQLLDEARAAHQAEPTQLTQESLERSHIEFNVLREKVCKSRLARHPQQIELNLPLANSLENLGKSAEAIGCLEKAAVEPALRARAALQLGQLMERARRIPEALSAYRRAALFRVPPPSREIQVKALTAAAHLAQASGMVDSALRYFEMLDEIQPDDPAVQERLVELRTMPL